MGEELVSVSKVGCNSCGLYSNTITEQEGDELLGLLDGLPLALAQAAAYMSETGTRFSTYTRLYNEQ